ncbi:hypothetical protein CNR37_00087 [Pseudomonas phage ventosus]|uniref:Uncharacterized protein n=1 Tax=Pseudomonas phage ventosus TaxID=2048980 RepID=A0A2H4P7Y2_9CAUD|nr:hypothetical protein CNR37_00087 [Pseudomonas phage ventosus]
MEWFVIYIFVMIEKLAALLALGWAFFWGAIVVLGFTFFAASMSSIENRKTTAEQMKEPGFKSLATLSKWVMGIGLLFGILTYFVPTQKDLAIIVGSGITYKAVTSETGQRLGGKAVDFLEKKLDDALGESKPEAPQEPAQKKQDSPKGQAL